jgi:hypothetical protein
MTKLLIQHRAIEAQLKSLSSELEAIEGNPAYQKELAFSNALESLMKEYGKGMRDIILILDPDAREADTARPARGPAPGTPRKVVKYLNPHTNEHLETASGNNKVLKQWKAQYPSDNIKEWIVGDE